MILAVCFTTSSFYVRIPISRDRKPIPQRSILWHITTAENIAITRFSLPLQKNK
uniref:Uncharacterized protein n=1 Tax=Arundo donax TaxID=35708 RepID=A0A0A9HAP5_ARUDO